MKIKYPDYSRFRLIEGYDRRIKRDGPRDWWATSGRSSHKSASPAVVPAWMPTPTLVGATGAATFRIDESSRQGGVSITSYDFEIDVAGGDFSNPTARGSLSASDGAVGIIVTPLQAGTYIARARAVDATGTGAWSESSAPTVVSPAAPAAPTPFALISGAEPALFVTQSGAVPLADVVSVGTPAYVDGVLALDGNDLRVPYAALPPPTNGWTLIAEITPSVISGSCTIISAQTAWNEHGTVYLNGGPGQVWRTIYSAKGVTIAGGAVLSTASFVGRRAVFALASSPGDHRAVVEGEVVNALTAPAGPALPFSVLSFGRNMWSSSTAFRAVMHWAYFAPYAMTTDEIRAISAQMSSATIVGDEPAKLVTASGPAPLADAISAGALTYEGGALRTDGNGFAIDLADLPSWVDGWTLIADVTIREVTGGAGTIISLERKYNDHVSLVRTAPA